MKLMLAVFELSIAGSVMALPVLFLRPVIRRKLPSVSMWVLWFIVLIVFLIPLNFQSPVSVQNVVNMGVASQYMQDTLSYDIVPANAVNDTAAAAGYASQEDNNLSTGVILTILWLSGLLGLAGNFAYRRLELYWRFRGAVLLESDRWQKYLHSFRRKIRVYTSDTLEAAITYGVIRPKIILPRALLLDDEKTISHVILHEAQHIRNFDCLLNTAWLCLLCIHWFNPVVWLCRIFARKDRELLCDISVVKKLGVSNRADYARTILELTPVRESCSLASSFGSLSAKDRIIRIMSYRRATVRTWCALALLLGILFTVFAPNTLAAFTNAFVTYYPDSTGRYVLLEVTRYQTGGVHYESFDLLGSCDTPDALVNKTGLTVDQDSSNTSFGYNTEDGKMVIYSFQSVSFCDGNAEYLLLDQSSFSIEQSDMSVQAAISEICELDWGC